MTQLDQSAARRPVHGGYPDTRSRIARQAATAEAGAEGEAREMLAQFSQRDGHLRAAEILRNGTLSTEDGSRTTIDAMLAFRAATPATVGTFTDGVKGIWRERWYGSEPERGSAITDERGNLIAYLGGDEEAHRAVTAIVSAHNAAICTLQPGAGREDCDAHFNIIDGRMIALPGWRRENLATYLRLMLEATNVTSEADVAGWTDAQVQEADIWACSVHLSASDNDDIIVPPRPSFIPVADPYAGRNPMNGAPLSGSAS